VKIGECGRGNAGAGIEGERCFKREGKGRTGVQDAIMRVKDGWRGGRGREK